MKSNPDFEVTILTSNNSKIVQYRAIVTMADQLKVVYGLSNGIIFNDLEEQTQTSRSHHSLTLNISEMAKDTAIVTMECE